jgi:hypothetical protein
MSKVARVTGRVSDPGPREVSSHSQGWRGDTIIGLQVVSWGASWEKK